MWRQAPFFLLHLRVASVGDTTMPLVRRQTQARTDTLCPTLFPEPRLMWDQIQPLAQWVFQLSTQWYFPSLGDTRLQGQADSCCWLLLLRSWHADLGEIDTVWTKPVLLALEPKDVVSTHTWSLDLLDSGRQPVSVGSKPELYSSTLQCDFFREYGHRRIQLF